MFKFLILAFHNTAVGIRFSAAGVVLQPCRPSVSANTYKVPTTPVTQDFWRSQTLHA
jgi:hypothetical protein